MLERLHVDAVDLGIVRDDPGARSRIARARRADAVITSGGVSVGEADFTRDVMARLGDVTFASVALRPGRPLACGIASRADGAGHALFFGLPGNPVASAVTFYAIVRPALLTLAGAQAQPPAMHTALSTQALKTRPGRTDYLRGVATRRRRPLARRTGRLAEFRVAERPRGRQLFHRPATIPRQSTRAPRSTSCRSTA